MVVAEAVGRMMSHWGFRRTMGTVWTLLYLSPEPLRPTDVAARLRISAGTAQATLTALARWGAAEKTWRAGERGDLYSAERSIWKSVRRVLRERELVLLAEVKAALAAAVEQIEDEPVRPARELRARRVGRLLRMAERAEEMLGALARDPAEPTGIPGAS